MRTTALRILAALQEGPATVTRLADRLDKNQGWISELVTDLESQHLVDHDQRVALADTYETGLLLDLFATYDPETVLAGTKEPILRSLLDGPKTVADLELDGFAASTVYQAVNDLQTVGVIEKDADGAYRLSDETVQRFLDARRKQGSRTTAYETDGATIRTGADQAAGQPTAFSAFQRYGIDYYPAETYRYQGEQAIGMEDVLIHAVRFAETKQQTGMTAVFYLTHSTTLDTDRLWQLADKWGCVERWADLLAFLDQRDVKQADRFLPWDEFLEVAHEYDVYPRGKHPADSLLAGLDGLGETLQTDVAVYLLGGGNLILRGLKDATKEIDVVVENRQILRAVVEALQQQGYEERRDLDAVYEQLDPSIVLEKQGFPRWDIFVETVAGDLQLTDAMRTRTDETRRFNHLAVHLLTVTDIFLFKAITDREGDLEDTALLARQGDVDWDAVFAELQRQETLTDQYFSFAVLDTLDLLNDRYDITVPIHDRLVTYCLENALLLTLDEPKTIRDLRDALEFPDHRIYNTLRNLEDEEEITVDRTGTLNTYERTGR